MLDFRDELDDYWFDICERDTEDLVEIQEERNKRLDREYLDNRFI